MHHPERTGPSPRARLARGLSLVGALALLFAVLPAGTASAHYARTWEVTPDQSIQEAVDRAGNGDVIKLAAGSYEQAVCVDGKGLTVIGAGRDQTRIVWPDWSDPSEQVDAPASGNACWRQWASHDPESTPGTTQRALADDVSALFFLNPRGSVTVTGLSTYNHPANGIVVESGNGFRVAQTKGSAHDRYGIVAANTPDIVIKDNLEIGRDRGTATAPNSGTAGVGISDTAGANAQVSGNYAEGWNIGFFVREARTGQLADNSSKGNCVGINLFDDGNTEVPPNPNSTIPAGDWAVVGNRVVDNHRFCLAGIGQVAGQLRVSGTGVAVVNMDTVLVKDNYIADNGPRQDIDPATLQFPPGGLILLTLPLFNTPNPNAAGPVEDVTVVDNEFRDNVPLDILLGSPPGTPPANQLPPVTPEANRLVFSGNSCATSYPPGTAGCDTT